MLISSTTVRASSANQEVSQSKPPADPPPSADVKTSKAAILEAIQSDYDQAIRKKTTEKFEALKELSKKVESSTNGIIGAADEFATYQIAIKIAMESFYVEHTLR